MKEREVIGLKFEYGLLKRLIDRERTMICELDERDLDKKKE